MDTAPLILLAAGGTGGHLFPAQALGVELVKRGLRVRLVTDDRALRYSGLFSKDMIDVVASETARGRNPLQLAYAGLTLAAGTVSALRLMRRLKPAAVVGFGGYPTLPPLIAARLAGIPSIIHDANAVLGRANRFLSRHVSAIATSLPGVLDRDGALSGKATTVGTPMRPAVLERGGIALHGARAERNVAPAGCRRQPGRARDERHRARRNRTPRACAMEPCHPHPAGARGRHDSRARGL